MFFVERDTGQSISFVRMDRLGAERGIVPRRRIRPGRQIGTARLDTLKTRTKCTLIGF